MKASFINHSLLDLSVFGGGDHIATGEKYEFESAKAAEAILGMSRSGISQVLAGKKKSIKGYVFRFQSQESKIAT